MTVLFFQNGNTAVTDDKEQQPELQRPWLLLFVEFLESRGIDPTKQQFLLPSGRNAKVFKLHDGSYNWEVV